MRSWLIIFEVIVGTVIVFTAFRQQAFWRDCVAWFADCGNIFKSICENLNGMFSSFAEWICIGIANGTLRGIVYWSVDVLLWVATAAMVYLISHILWDRYAEKVCQTVTTWVVSVWLLLLMCVVYLGDYIAMILPLNLFGIWLIGSVAVLGVGMYVNGCKKYRY